jgi:polysaccharide biosynthesis/export protein
MRYFLALCLLVASASAGAQGAPSSSMGSASTGSSSMTSPPMARPAAAANAAAGDQADYVLGPQDILKVMVFDEPALTGSFKVDGDGAFSYPYLDRVKAGGRTPRDLKEEIEKRLADGFVRRPQVSVEVEQFRARNVQVVGEVRSPGKYALVGQTTLLEALAQAGYMTSNAGSEVMILHQANGVVPPGAVTTAGVPTTRVSIQDLQQNRPGANPLLREGDTVVVNKAEKLTVTGHVRTPGQVVWERGMTVRIALALAGGVSEKGSTRGIRVLREEAGTRVELEIGIDDVVEPNDILTIRQRLL